MSWVEPMKIDDTDSQPSLHRELAGSACWNHRGRKWSRRVTYVYTAIAKTAVTAYLEGEQLLLFDFVWQSTEPLGTIFGQGSLMYTNTNRYKNTFFALMIIAIDII